MVRTLSSRGRQPGNRAARVAGRQHQAADQIRASQRHVLGDDAAQRSGPGRGEFRLRDRGIGDDAVEQLDRLARSHVLASSAGDQLTQQRVDPAHRLGAQPTEVVVAARPDRITMA
jgi:hypothetical protein